MAKSNLKEWDLVQIITEFIQEFPDVVQIHLFGSRAFKTGSYRSDIDLLVTTSKPIPAVRLSDWIVANYEAIDIFRTVDNKLAESAINGSSVNSKSDLVAELKAIKLWDKNEGFDKNYTDWKQYTREGITFSQTVAYIPYNLNEAIKDFDKFLTENDYPNTNLGIDWPIIGERLSKKINVGIDFLSRWNKNSGSFNKVELTNEADFQNLIELILKPWLPDTERETTVARFDGQEKKIDFSIQLNRILIEVKHIKDKNTEAKAVKEIEGITKFYLSNTNVRLLLFFILIESSHDLDKGLFEKAFSSRRDGIEILTKCFTNTLEP